MQGQGQSIDALSADLKAASSHMNEVEAQVTHAEHWNRIMPQLSKTLGCLMNLCFKHGFMYYITPQICPEEASFINRSQSSHTVLIVPSASHSREQGALPPFLPPCIKVAQTQPCGMVVQAGGDSPDFVRQSRGIGH